MGFFGSKKSVGSEAYEKLANKIAELQIEFNKIEAKFGSLRGFVYRKYPGDNAEQKAESNTIDDGFDDLRKLNKEHGSHF